MKHAFYYAAMSRSFNATCQLKMKENLSLGGFSLELLALTYSSMSQQLVMSACSRFMDKSSPNLMRERRERFLKSNTDTELTLSRSFQELVNPLKKKFQSLMKSILCVNGLKTMLGYWLIILTRVSSKTKKSLRNYWLTISCSKGQISSLFPIKSKR